MSIKGLLSLCFGLALIALGIWFTQNQATREQQWNLQREAARGAVPGENRQSAPDTSDPIDQASEESEGIADVLP